MRMGSPDWVPASACLLLLCAALMGFPVVLAFVLSAMCAASAVQAAWRCPRGRPDLGCIVRRSFASTLGAPDVAPRGGALVKRRSFRCCVWGLCVGSWLVFRYQVRLGCVFGGCWLPPLGRKRLLSGFFCAQAGCLERYAATMSTGRCWGEPYGISWRAVVRANIRLTLGRLALAPPWGVVRQYRQPMPASPAAERFDPYMTIVSNGWLGARAWLGVSPPAALLRLPGSGLH